MDTYFFPSKENLFCFILDVDSVYVFLNCLWILWNLIDIIKENQFII